MRKRILLGDDHALFLEGLARLLENEFEIVGTVLNGRILVEMAERLNPDVVVLDIGMPELNGIEAGRKLVKLIPLIKIVYLTQQLDRAYLKAAFSIGAMGYVVKQSAANDLIKAIHMAIEGRYYVSPLAGEEAHRLTDLNPKYNPAELFGTRLTPRQREVLQMVAEGKSTKEISSALCISQKTVEFHRNSLMDELGMRTIAELTRYAVSQGIVAS
jgi:DNA-binding NarL/FixJ family response regulator